MITDRHALNYLAELCAIQPVYHDIWNQQHDLSDHTKQRFLQAMGLQVDSDAEVHQALAARHQRAWRQVLPAAVVLATGKKPHELIVTLPEDLGLQRFAWTLEDETGLRREGAFFMHELRRVEQGQVDLRTYCRLVLPLADDLALGYFRFTLRRDAADAQEPMAQALIIVAPATCYLPESFHRGGRLWGLAVQLYALRSRRNWGVGDFSDLAQLVEVAAGCGAHIIGLNPLHALFAHNPAHCSPYSPSSRAFINPLYLDITAIEEFATCAPAQERFHNPELQATLGGLRDLPLVDYPAVAAVKRPFFELLYAHFCSHHIAANTARAQAFHAYVRDQGEPLASFALFEALQEHFVTAQPHAWWWHAWPQEYRDCRSPQVQEFAQAHAERLRFAQYLQWLCDAQLARVQTKARQLGMQVGLYRDLAVGIDGAGADTWRYPGLFALGTGVGAPPDGLNLAGQNWGLPPMTPETLKESRFAPFIEALRQNMGHAGALRIDHVMGLLRLFWVPPDGSARDGGYVLYPMEELFSILALESQRHQCMVIGEDLGTVPDAIRHAMQRFQVLSYRILWFECHHDGTLKELGEFPPLANVAVATHDLATLAGYWQGHDLALRDQLQLFPSTQIRDGQYWERGRARGKLVEALARQGLVPDGLNNDNAQATPMTENLARAVHTYLARSPAQLMMVQLEDVLGEVEQANLPGTTDQHPNWRRKLSCDLDDLSASPRLHALAQDINQTRRP